MNFIIYLYIVEKSPKLYNLYFLASLGRCLKLAKEMRLCPPRHWAVWWTGILSRASTDLHKVLKFPTWHSGPASLTTAGSSFPPAPRSMCYALAGVREIKPNSSHSSNWLTPPIADRWISGSLNLHTRVGSVCGGQETHPHQVTCWMCYGAAILGQQWLPLCPALRLCGARTRPQPSLHAHPGLSKGRKQQCWLGEGGEGWVSGHQQAGKWVAKNPSQRGG